MNHMPEPPETSGCMCVELEADMLTCKTEPRCIIPNKCGSFGTQWEGHGFFEAASVRKVGGNYYIVYCSEQVHELCYAVSGKPDSGFRFCGTLISNGDIGYKGLEQKNCARRSAHSLSSSIPSNGKQWWPLSQNSMEHALS